MTTLTKPASPATAKQIAFISTLMDKAYGENAPEAYALWAETESTSKEASAEIERLLAVINAKPKATNVIPNGVHMINGFVIRIRTSKTGNQYGERLLTQIEQEEHGCEWLYEGRKALKGASADTLLTLAQAKAYGAAYGVCAVCGARLKDIDSIEAGIGPVCAKKF